MSNLLNGKTNQLWDRVYVKLILFFLITVYVFMLKKSDASIGIVLAGLPVGLLFVTFLFMNPRFALITLFYYNYFAMGLTRYVPGQLGLGVDGLLFLTYLGLFFKSYKGDVGFSRMRNELSLIALIWYMYALFQLINPEVQSRIAWVYGMRGLALYFFMTIPLTFVVFDKYKDFNLLLKLWSIFTILGALKGMQQLYIGMDYAEQAWLDRGGALTHIIWSGLRVFSFFTDAGQFGVSMGQSGVAFAILAMGQPDLKKKVYYFIVSFLGIYGMFISGTRGAMAVPAAGFFTFLILIKNWKLVMAGTVFLFLVFVFFNFTMIGNGNAQIRRMRSSFDTNDASLKTRHANQAKLKTYMATRPFGCGIGTTGAFGARYTPYLFVSQIPTDSWFVAIWVEFGEVGLKLHLFILFFCLFRGGYILMTRIRDRELYYKITGILCGYIGVVGASYGNPVLGQMPVSIITYMCLSFVFMSPRFQNQIDEQEKNLNKII